MERHELLTGETVDLTGLSPKEQAFLAQLRADAAAGAEYFDLLRRVKGPEALPLRGGPITPAIAASAFYRAAHDIADRAGIEQGYVLDPALSDVATARQLGAAEELLSLTEAAELIGISRPATHQALVEERLRGQRVGKAWVIRRADAEAFKNARSERSGASA